MTKKILIVFLLIFFSIVTTRYLSEQKRIRSLQETISKIDTSETVQINEINLKKNLFRSTIDPDYDWIGVSGHATVYGRQYYTRDTLVTFIGGVEAHPELRDKIAHVIDWYSDYINDDGSIPMWVRETNILNIYHYTPYNMTPKDGAIRQLDNHLQYIDAIYLYYKKTKNTDWLKKRIPYARKVYKYLNKKTENYLVIGDYSFYAGNDWSDQIRRSGKSLFINAYWYKINKDMAEMEAALDNNNASMILNENLKHIKREFNKTFWTVSKPKNCDLGTFGHYLAWKNDRGTFDYFELDGNGLAMGVGLSEDWQSKSIMKVIHNNFDYFVNKHGATRNPCGLYDEEVTRIKPGVFQNGGYWYITSYYLTMAFVSSNDSEKIIEMYNRSSKATKLFEKEGLAEWYYQDGKIGGALNYSWSIAYPIYLSSIINSMKHGN